MDDRKADRVPLGRPCQLHRFGRRRPRDRTGRGRDLHRARPGIGRQGSGLRAGRRRLDFAVENSSWTAPSTIPANAAAGSSASMCTSSVYDRFVGAFADLTVALRARQPADAGDDARARWRRTRFADSVRAQTREALAKGARPLIDPRRFPLPTRADGVSGAAGSRRRRSFHAGDDGGELRPRRRHHEGHVRRGGDRLMNDSPYGLTASVWTADADAAERDRRCGSRPARSS